MLLLLYEEELCGWLTATSNPKTEESFDRPEDPVLPLPDDPKAPNIEVVVTGFSPAAAVTADGLLSAAATTVSCLLGTRSYNKLPSIIVESKM